MKEHQGNSILQYSGLRMASIRKFQTTVLFLSVADQVFSLGKKNSRTVERTTYDPYDSFLRDDKKAYSTSVQGRPLARSISRHLFSIRHMAAIADRLAICRVFYSRSCFSTCMCFVRNIHITAKDLNLRSI
jgi:hypothetical protein